MERIDNGLLDFGILLQPVDTSAYDSIKLPVKDPITYSIYNEDLGLYNLVYLDTLDNTIKCQTIKYTYGAPIAS